MNHIFIGLGNLFNFLFILSAAELLNRKNILCIQNAKQNTHTQKEEKEWSKWCEQQKNFVSFYFRFILISIL